MSGFSHYPLQQAIYQKLTEDNALMTQISGVFDRPPQDSSFPYVTIGESSGRDWSTKTSTGMEHLITLHVWSREGGRKQAANIMERIHALLHQGSLTVTGQILLMMRFTASTIQLENDGWTYRGSMQLTIVLEAS